MKFRTTWLFLLAASAALCWTVPASAERITDAATEQTSSPWYYGITVTKGTFKVDGELDADVNTLDFHLVRMINDYIGIEGRLGLGFNENNVTNCVYVNAQPVCDSIHVRIEESAGVYARGYMTGPGRVRPYAVAGITSSRTAVTQDSLRVDADKQTVNDISYGLGLQAGGDNTSFTLEYISLFDKDGQSVDGFSIGVLVHY